MRNNFILEEEKAKITEWKLLLLSTLESRLNPRVVARNVAFRLVSPPELRRRNI